MNTIAAGKAFKINGHTVCAYPVSHTVPAVGYVVSDKKGRSLLYTGDTGPTEAIWQAQPGVNAAIVEVSLPNSMAGLALKTGHLTAKLLKKELAKLRVLPEKIFITHPKPQYMGRITKEIEELNDKGKMKIRILKSGEVHEV
jgi:ribonuclease BN (tRNA processing enzyme)